MHHTRLTHFWTLALAAGLYAQEPPPPSIRTTGEASVSAQPDRAVIDLGVVTQSQNAQSAAAENAKRLDTVLRALKGAAGGGAAIKTVSYSLDPDYRYPKQGGQPEIAGYTARNTVEVTTPDLTSVGRIIDAATQAGANAVQRVEFSLKDDQAARGQALRQAAQKARANAEAIASSLGLRITRVLRVEESVPPEIRPMESRVAAMAAPVPTPVTPGTVEIRATVRLVVEIGQ